MSKVLVPKNPFFAGLHFLMRAIRDGPADAGRRIRRYWYRESRCQVMHRLAKNLRVRCGSIHQR